VLCAGSVCTEVGLWLISPADDVSLRLDDGTDVDGVRSEKLRRGVRFDSDLDDVARLTRVAGGMSALAVDMWIRCKRRCWSEVF